MARYLFILFLLGPALCTAQIPKDSSIFKLPISMDEVVVKAVRNGWDVAGFIKRVRTDTTFYKAFRSLHVVSYTSINDFKVYDNKAAVKASYYSKTRQNVLNGCRTMDVLEEKVTGDFFKSNRRYRYYTAELYDHLFFVHGKICGETDIVAGTLNEQGKGQLEKSSYKLKQLMFNPGSKVAGVPFMGDKAAIFEPGVAKMYEFKLSSEEYNGQDCYVFKAIPKKQYEKDVVYNEFTTWFRKSDYSILARDYSLSFNTMVYDFNVRMKVRMQELGKRLLPARIEYDGNWHIFTKSRERVKFTATIIP
jgi:hypothetical protein